ncbi:hypothetical protein RVBP20_3120 [Pseudomonas phage sp. NK1]|nr:hypothetical protein RVBP20_3120 [Pseudomonas phage sp. NK1]
MTEIVIALILSAIIVYLINIFKHPKIIYANSVNDNVFIVTGCSYVSENNEDGTLTTFSPKLNNRLIIDLTKGQPNKDFYISVLDNTLKFHHTVDEIITANKWEALFKISITKEDVCISGIPLKNKNIKCNLHWVIAPSKMVNKL